MKLNKLLKEDLRDFAKNFEFEKGLRANDLFEKAKRVKFKRIEVELGFVEKVLDSLETKTSTSRSESGLSKLTEARTLSEKTRGIWEKLKNIEQEYPDLYHEYFFQLTNLEKRRLAFVGLDEKQAFIFSDDDYSLSGTNC